MSTVLMARRKRDPKTVAIAKAILEQYDCKNVENMQDAIKKRLPQRKIQNKTWSWILN